MRKDQEIYKKTLLAQLLDGKKRWRPRLCWRDEVDEDARMFGLRNW
jgi:hypothetical protein